MDFVINQKVSFLYEKGFGIIRDIKENQFLVEDETGFDRWFLKSEIVKIHSLEFEKVIYIPNKETEINTDKLHRVLEQKSASNRGPVIWELDLHIDEILDSTRGLSNSDMLLKQLSEFRSTFKKAKAQNAQRLIVIHGVGAGVLKNEIRMYLDVQEQVEYFDADFSEYGKGATEINFHPNWKRNETF